MNERAGFIGLGNIGGPMAMRLTAWPGGLTVFDVDPGATAAAARAGARVASSAADVIADATIVSLMVRDDADVDAVLNGDDGLLAAVDRTAAGGSVSDGLIVAIHSTIGADSAQRFAAMCEPFGVAIVDAPVSGGAPGAHSGRLAAMVGGSAEAVERCRPVFSSWADLVVHTGDVGSGTAAKLARNLLHFAAFTAVGEAQRLAEAAGINPAELGRVVRHSDAVTGGPGAIMLRDTTELLAADDPFRPIFEHTLALGTKDLRLARELGERLGVELPLAEVATRWLGRALGVVEELSAEVEDNDQR